MYVIKIWHTDRCSTTLRPTTLISWHLFTRQMFRDRYFATLVPRQMFRDKYFATLISATDISRQIFRDTCSSDRSLATQISRHLFPRQIFRDTCSSDRCFATDLSRHLLPKIFFSLISSTGRLDNDVIFLPFSFPLLLQKITSLSSLPVELIKEKKFWVTNVAVTSVTKHLSRNICRSKCRGDNCHKTFVGVTFVLKQLW